MALIDSETGEFITRNTAALHVKIPHAMQERIFEYANHQVGTNINQAIRDLIELGVDVHDKRQAELAKLGDAKTPEEKAKLKDSIKLTGREKTALKLWHSYRREHERNLLKTLASSRDFDEKDFAASCRDMGFASEAQQIREDALAEREHEKINAKRVQRDVCGYWLRGMLQAKPDASMSDLEKQGEAWNFSKQQITRALSEIGAIKSGAARATTWRLPK